jgi:hypothetical protein
MTVYVVWASKGEYDDFNEWIEKAFLSKEKAEDHALDLGTAPNPSDEYFKCNFDVRELEVG